MIGESFMSEYIDVSQAKVCTCHYPDYELAVKHVYSNLFGLSLLVSKMVKNNHIVWQAAEMFNEEIVKTIAQLDLETDRICGCYE
jgi:hypothetical protein